MRLYFTHPKHSFEANPRQGLDPEMHHKWGGTVSCRPPATGHPDWNTRNQTGIVRYADELGWSWSRSARRWPDANHGIPASIHYLLSWICSFGTMGALTQRVPLLACLDSEASDLFVVPGGWWPSLSYIGVNNSGLWRTSQISNRQTFHMLCSRLHGQVTIGSTVDFRPSHSSTVFKGVECLAFCFRECVVGNGDIGNFFASTSPSPVTGPRTI